MSVPLILILLAPLAGTVLALAFAEFPLQRRALVGLCLAAGAAGAGYGLVRTIAGSGVGWRGFTLDPWRGLLAAGAVLLSALAVARADDHDRAPIVQAAFLAATAGLVAPLLLSEAHTLAVALPVGTAGFALAGFAAAAEGPSLLRTARSAAALAASDVLALIALGLSLASGTRLPPELSTTSAAILLAAAILRLGLVPVAWAGDDADGAHRGLGLMWNGAVRAQGFLLALMAIGSHRGVAYAAAAVAVSSLVVSGVRAFGGSSAVSARSLSSIGTAVALLGFALGGAPATWGAVLALAAAFASSSVWSAGGNAGAPARATMGAIPAGGLLAGATLVVTAALDAGTARPWFLALAVPGIAGLLAAAAAAWMITDDTTGGEKIIGRSASALGILSALALAAVPARALTGLSLPVSSLLGTGGLLTARQAPGVPEDLAAVALAAGLVAFAVGWGRTGSGGVPQRRGTPGKRTVFDWWGAAGTTPAAGSIAARARAENLARRWGAAGTLLFAAAVGLALRVYVVASGRGFL